MTVRGKYGSLFDERKELNMNAIRWTVWAALVIAGLGYSARAEETQSATTAPDAAMMEKMAALSSPSEAHKLLETFAGTWTFSSKFSMGPDSPPMGMDGTSVNTLIFGGRFLKQEVKGTWQGAPFEGIGYLGYDNVKQEYVSIWIDSSATAIISESGQYDADTRTIKSKGVNSCPMTGEKAREGTSETIIVSADLYKYIARSTGTDGKEMVMEINYSRVP